MKWFYVLNFLLVVNFSFLYGQNPGEDEIVEAIRKGDLHFLSRLDSVTVNTPFHGRNGNALLFAIEHGSAATVKTLLQQKANPNYAFRTRTMLMYAVQEPETAKPRLLLQYGADVNAADSLGNTALMIAATGQKVSLVKMLIRKGASLNVRNKKGLNARDFAIRSHNKAISIYLKNIFEKKLPDYFDGPYVNYITGKKIKVSYLKHDSLRKRTESIYKYFKLKELNNELQGFAGDPYSYPLQKNFKNPPAEISNVSKLLVIGDVHGQYDTLKVFLQNNRVTDSNMRWIYGSGSVVFIGDIFDRGDKVTEALWLIYRLEKEAAAHGGSVHLLLGNHELMVMMEDERFISEKYFYLFRNLKLSYSKYYNNRTLLGRWLRTRNTFLKVDSMLFVHGGVHPNMLHYNLSLDSANRLVTKYLTARKKHAYADHLALQFLLSYNGPFWYRGMVESYDDNLLTPDQVSSILNAYNVNHIVVGHTYKPEIKRFSYNKVIATDTPFYLPDGSAMQALLIENGKFKVVNSRGEAKEF